MSPYEIGGILFGLVSVWLTIEESLWCWPTGIVSVGLYILVFWRTRLYADAALQGAYVVLSFYGWWAWLRGGENHRALVVTRTPRGILGALLVLGALGSWLVGYGLRAGTDAVVPYWDAATTSFSIVAQVLMTRKWLENWILWIVVDFVLVGKYVSQGLLGTAGLYLLYTLLAIRGLLEWRRHMDSVREP